MDGRFRWYPAYPLRWYPVCPLRWCPVRLWAFGRAAVCHGRHGKWFAQLERDVPAAAGAAAPSLGSSHSSSAGSGTASISSTQQRCFSTSGKSWHFTASLAVMMRVASGRLASHSGEMRA